MPENKIEEVDILNFALNLESLEAEFYTYATTGKSITSFGIATKGRANGANPASGGTTKGARKSSFPKRNPSFTILPHRSVPTNVPTWCCCAAHSALLRLRCPTST